MHFFSFRKLFRLVSVAFLVLYCCSGMVREKRGGREAQGEDAWSIKYDKTKCFQVIQKLQIQTSLFYIYEGLGLINPRSLHVGYY